MLHRLCQKSRPGISPVGCILKSGYPMEFLPELVAECGRFHVLHRVQIEHLEQRRHEQAQRLTRIAVPTLRRLGVQKPDGVGCGHLGDLADATFPFVESCSTLMSGMDPELWMRTIWPTIKLRSQSNFSS